MDTQVLVKKWRKNKYEKLYEVLKKQAYINTIKRNIKKKNYK